MKKLVMMLPLVAMLAACSTTDQYAKRAEAERERKEKYVERSINKAPDWMFKVPTSSNAVFESGTSTSLDFSYAVLMAKDDAYRKICMTAGGTMTMQNKSYRAEGENSATVRNEMVSRSFCDKVDLTGVELRDKKIISEGTRYRVYVLVALPTGDANILRRAKEQRRIDELAAQRAPEAFKEIQ